MRNRRLLSQGDTAGRVGCGQGGVRLASMDGVFRVEPAVAQPAPPQTRTCAINAYGSSVTRVSAPLWCITFAALHSHIRWCERSWVWAERASPTAFGTSPSRSHSYYCDG